MATKEEPSLYGRLAGPLDLFDERAQLAILAVDVEVRPLAAGNPLFGRGVPVSEHVSDGLVAGSVFGSRLDLGAILVSFVPVPGQANVLVCGFSLGCLWFATGKPEEKAQWNFPLTMSSN